MKVFLALLGLGVGLYRKQGELMQDYPAHLELHDMLNAASDRAE